MGIEQFGLPISVPLLSSANVFTAAQTIQNTAGLTLQTTGGLTSVKAYSSGSGQAGYVDFYGANAPSASKVAWSWGLDTTATTPLRDFGLARVNTDGSSSDADGLYWSYVGGTASTPSQAAFGMTAPADLGGGPWPVSRLTLQNGGTGGTAQGCLFILQNATAAAPNYALTIADNGAKWHMFVDQTGGTSTWPLTLRGDATTGNPLFLLQDINAGNAEQFRVTAQGLLTFKGDANAGLSRVAASQVASVSSFQVQNNLIVGGGAAAGTAPTAQGDFVTSGASVCSLFVRNTTQGTLQMQMLGAGNAAKISTSNASSLSFATNGATKIQISGAGGLGFYGATPVTQAARAVTLADVITVLANVGLTA